MSAPARANFGKYQVVKLLGEGAMGVVYQAHDPSLDRQVAVKMIRKDVLDGKHASLMLLRFRNEAMAAGRLLHPGIVAVHDYGEDDNTSFIVMEYAPGVDLEEHVRQRGGGSPLPLPEVVNLMTQLLDALSYAHGAGVIHRDIKPSNLMILADGRLKITDFGIARIASSTLTQTGMALGTPAYMAPEQYMGTAVDQRADLFSSGVVLYELLTGAKPFDGDSVHQLAYKICHVEAAPPTTLNPKLPAAADALMVQALAKQKEQRFASALAMSRAVAGALGDAPFFQPAGPPAPRAAAPTSLTQEELDKATQALVAYVGPIAKVLVKKASAQARDFRQLCESLCQHLSSDKERKGFLEQVGIR